MAHGTRHSASLSNKEHASSARPSSLPASTDPIADTPMTVTLDELRPYELNPRIARNPKYDELKGSIRERGLDAPPAITRRPGEAHFIIRNGGNTRLSILRELWTETKDERFFRIHCLFRPWSPRGEIVALTGHLAENELHGELSFIERALGVEKARELYEQELGKPLSQRELARKLTSDGYPISHSLVNRMQDTVRHLLPVIPTVLYGGLGRPQVERLSALRRAGARVWERHASPTDLQVDFQVFFGDVLSSLDADPERFNTQRAQDELIRQLARLLSLDYDTLALELIDAEGIADAINRDPPGQPPLNAPFQIEERVTSLAPVATSPSKSRLATPSSRTTTPREPTTPRHARDDEEWDAEDDSEDDDAQARITSPSETVERLPTMHVAAESAAESPLRDDIAPTNAIRPNEVPSISDLGRIELSLDAPRDLRAQIAQLATEVAAEGSLAERIKVLEDGVGYACIAARSGSKDATPFQRALVSLLTALSARYTNSADTAVGHDNHMHGLWDELGPLLQGTSDRNRSEQAIQRLSDVGLEKLFRSIWLARRLLDVEAADPLPPKRMSA